MKTRSGIIVIIAAAILASGGILIYRSRMTANDTGDGQTSVPATPNSSSSTASPTPAQTQTPATYDVSVYFSRSPESDNDPSKVFPVKRVSTDLGVAAFAISELLKGPTDAEKAQKYTSDVRLREGESTCSGKDFTVTVTDGLAVLQFCKAFDHAGELSDGRAESQINATLLQFPSVNRVRILNSAGGCEFNLSDLNLCLQ